MDVQVKFLNKTTVLIRAFVYDDAGDLEDPTTSIKVTIVDPNGVQKAGRISVSDSASFTANLVVTGGTSGATGVVISKPSGTTLELQRVTGVWQSGETIEDTGSGTSTTTSLLLGADMTKNTDYAKGVYDYKYRTDADSPAGDWPGEVWVVDGSGATAVNSPGTFSFEVKAGL